MTDSPVQLSPEGPEGAGDARNFTAATEENFENACRLCMTTDLERCSIFAVPHGPVPFIEKIRSCLSIQVSTNDKTSTLICTNCVENVNQWHGYKETCLQSQDKFMQWMVKTGTFPHQTVTIKEEPVDLAYTEDPSIEILCDTMPQINQMHMNNGTTMVAIPNNIDILTEENFISPASKSKTVSPIRTVNKNIEKPRYEIDRSFNITNIKSEPMESDNEYSVEIDSADGSELLLNPMAVASGKDADRVVEADSTQKAKKKMRRGPHTHYRGARIFKRKCIHCNINLSSKTSFAKHMARFHDCRTYNNVPSNDHSPNLPSPTKKLRKQMPELTERPAGYRTDTVVDQTAGINRSAPLTPIQQNIISQLKTYSCYSCEKQFDDRRSTLNHIKQHLPNIKPYTCIACLIQFPDRDVYKQHCALSYNCAMKIAMVIPKHGVEKYFTCNMCLRPMPNRSELLHHLSKHSNSNKPCESTVSSLRPPPKLRPMVPGLTPLVSQHVQQLQVPQNSSHSLIPVDDGKPSVAPEIPGPYVNGDPSHNHMCDLCGMIYRYKPNMCKHREICETLTESERTSYRCVHCRMTFLIFKKFHSHLIQDHKKKDFVCFNCHAKFVNPNDFLLHHETHKPYSSQHSRVGERMNYSTERSLQSDQSLPETMLEPQMAPETEWDGYADDVPVNSITEERHNCALCNMEFSTNAELTEHRNLHLKVKIYSCVICRSMFSSSGALEIHMKDHGIEDPKEQNANSSCVEYGHAQQSHDSSDPNMSISSDPGGRNICRDCGRTFSNLANLRRHLRNVHTYASTFICSKCGKAFKSKETYEYHIKTDHNKSPKPVMRCPKCPRTFSYQGSLIVHCQTVHNDHQMSGFSCDICGKTFKEEQSLKTHRGWHMRTNNRLSIDKNRMVMIDNSTPVVSTPKPAKARKSFPNPQQQQLLTLQCQVCDDRFADVSELRKHLWEVHCSRNKSEKMFEEGEEGGEGEEGEENEGVSELQCQLCPDLFADEESLRAHMEWHEQNHESDEPKKTFCCETCGKHYSSRKLYLRHKKLHKSIQIAGMKLQSLNMKRPTCAICDKAFATEASLKRHKSMTSHYQAKRKPTDGQEALQMNLKKEPDLTVEVPIRKKPVTCLICKSVFPSMSVLYRHKQLVHKTHPNKDGSVPMDECIPLQSSEGYVCCNICGKQFPGISNLKQHFSHKHKQPPNTVFPCKSSNCKLVFSTLSALKSHETTHTCMIYSCNRCDRHVFNRGSMVKHVTTQHQAECESGVDEQTMYSETDLSVYKVKGATSTMCPKCKIKYPNMRALKIHYFKFHEKP